MIQQNLLPFTDTTDVNPAPVTTLSVDESHIDLPLPLPLTNLETSASYNLMLELSVDSQRTSSSSHQTSQECINVEDTTIAQFINDLKKTGENSTRKRVKKPTYNPSKRITRNDRSSAFT